MIFSPSRVFQSATVFVALATAPNCFCQTSQGSATPSPEAKVEFLLPDAPSYSSSQGTDLQQATTQQPSPNPAPTAQPPGQTTAPVQPPANETPEQKKERERMEGEEQVKKEEHQRNLGVIPMFNTVLGGTVPPLTAGQKFDLVYHTLKDPYTFVLAAIVSGFGELSTPAQGYGWGPVGYGYRYATAYGDNVDGALWGNAILPVLLKQDPRYYRMGPGHSVKSRIIHAALSTVICKGDNGKDQFNISNVLGNFIAGGLSNIYYPHAQRGYNLIYSNGLTVTYEGAAGAELLEFGPDLSGLISRHHQRALAKKAAAKAGEPTPNDE